MKRLLTILRALVAFFDRDPALERARRVGDELHEIPPKSAESGVGQQI